MRRWLVTARRIIHTVRPAQMPAMPSSGYASDERADRATATRYADRRPAEEAVVAGTDQHAVVGERDRGREHHHGEEPQCRRRARRDRRVAGEHVREPRRRHRHEDGEHRRRGERQPHGTRREVSRRRHGAAAELLGDERLGRHGEGVERQREEREQPDHDLVSGQRGLVDPGGDRRRPRRTRPASSRPGSGDGARRSPAGPSPPKPAGGSPPGRGECG